MPGILFVREGGGCEPRSLDQHQAVVIGVVRGILHHLDGVAVGPDRGIHIDTAGLHGGARLLGVDASPGSTFRAQLAWPASQPKGLVKAGQEYAAFQVADDSGGAADLLAADQDGVLVTGDHLTRLHVGGRMRGAAEARVIAVAAVPAFESDPGGGDDAGRCDQLGFQRPPFAGVADEGLDGCLGDHGSFPFGILVSGGRLRQAGGGIGRPFASGKVCSDTGTGTIRDQSA